MGLWRTKYEDKELGKVEGYATLTLKEAQNNNVDASNLELTLSKEYFAESPINKHAYPLKGRTIFVDDNKVVMNFIGFSPSKKKTPTSPLLKINDQEVKFLNKAPALFSYLPTSDDIAEFKKLDRQFRRDLAKNLKVKNPKLFEPTESLHIFNEDFTEKDYIGIGTIDYRFDLDTWNNWFYKDLIDQQALIDGGYNDFGFFDKLRQQKGTQFISTLPWNGFESGFSVYLKSQAKQIGTKAFQVKNVLPDQRSCIIGQEDFMTDKKVFTPSQFYFEVIDFPITQLDVWTKDFEVRSPYHPYQIQLRFDYDTTKAPELKGVWATPSASGIAAYGQRNGKWDADKEELTGKEEWIKYDHEIEGVIVLDDQRGYKEGFGPNTSFQYPFDGNAPDYAAKRRLLFVYGKKVAETKLRPLLFESSDAKNNLRFPWAIHR